MRRAARQTDGQGRELPTSGGVVGYASPPRWVTVRIETDRGSYEGRLHVPHGRRRPEDVLNDEAAFLSLVDVTMAGAERQEPLVTLNKRHIRTAQILDDGEGDREGNG